MIIYLLTHPASVSASPSFSSKKPSAQQQLLWCSTSIKQNAFGPQASVSSQGSESYYFDLRSCYMVCVTQRVIDTRTEELAACFTYRIYAKNVDSKEASLLSTAKNNTPIKHWLLYAKKRIQDEKIRPGLIANLSARNLNSVRSYIDGCPLQVSRGKKT